MDTFEENSDLSLEVFERIFEKKCVFTDIVLITEY